MIRRIAWGQRASADYHAQLEYIADQDPHNADLVDQRLMAAIEKLAMRPIGRVGRVAGTYEKSVLKTSLIVAYALEDEVVHILRIIHAKRNWPEGEWPKDSNLSFSRLQSIASGVAASATTPAMYINNITYNARGQTTRIDYADNSSTQGYFYDTNRGFLANTYMYRAGVTVMDQTYTRNAKGMITRIAAKSSGAADLARSWSYSYDGLDRLYYADNDNGTADDRWYGYDAADNMILNSGLCAGNPNMAYPTQAAYSGHPHAPSSICGKTVSYDANGNTTEYDVDDTIGPIQPRTLTSYIHPDIKREGPLVYSASGTAVDIFVNSA
jgi:toxin ParE1/3/4